ncbi:MAG: valine--tRNA ligase [Nanoarchaeota archaeon]
MVEYNFKEVEAKWLKFWEKEKVYKFDVKSKKFFSVDIPPPTVSGAMHIGHAFSYSQQDFVIRFRRMFEGSVFYPFGTDDNGLPTERLVEKLKNVKSKEMQRSKFIELCIKTIKEITPSFIQDWKNLGVSADYGTCYSTIDDNSRKISQKSFIDLYKNGHVYVKEFPTLWCPECQTSIAQAELEDKELPSLFSAIKFGCEEKDLFIATTRPELIGACVAIFVNPKDKRYKKIIGKNAAVPIFNYEIPIIGDESAEMKKGTGAMMICSYGDKYDVEAINRYKLNPRIIFNKDGTLILDLYKGMKIKEARKKILEDLSAKNLIKEQKQISHVVNVHDKCGTEIEFLPTEQWFIKILDKKKELVGQGKKINWHPEYMFKRYENWVNGLEWDWNISRNRHFGVPIPVWRCGNCNEIILAEEKELPVDPLQDKKKCPKCKKDAKGEEKVLDTWATSSLTPQIVSSLTKGVNIPLSLRPQAHDIIRTWAFYTIVKSYLHSKEVPWNDVMISGFVTLKGEKMSKSKGNVVDPSQVLSQYGADALRFWAAGSNLGEDVDYQENELVSGKRFVTKLLNASNFVFMNLKGYKKEKPKQLQAVDKIFLDKLFEMVNKATEAFSEYEYAKAKSEIETFFWKMFCDNYLEIVKKRVYQGSGDEKVSAQYTLYASLLTLLKLISPITPFIAEEIYQAHFKKLEKDKSIHISKWPEVFVDELHSAKYEKVLWNGIIEVISKVRQEKTLAKKPMNAEIILTLPEQYNKVLSYVLEDIKAVTNAKDIKTGDFDVKFVEINKSENTNKK